jgi:cytochrome c oxidase cbb3-type subunit 3
VKAPKDELLPHEVDGIREFDNALPRWWLYGFYFTIAFAAAYLVNYHVLAHPLGGATSIHEEYARELAAASRSRGASGGTASAPLKALTDAASVAKGRAIFEGPTNVCFSCHRPDLGGLVGPNLTDDYWIHGCSVAELVANVKSGFPPKGMMPFGSGQHLSDDEVLQVVSYVLSKRGSNPANPKAIDPSRDKPCS